MQKCRDKVRFCYCYNYIIIQLHSVLRLITKEGAKRSILDDITVVLKYF